MLTIRSVTNADIPKLDQFYATLGKIDDPGYFQECLIRADNGERDFYLAVQEGDIAGYVMLVWRPLYPMFRRLEIPEIQDLNVGPCYRRQGIGTRLVEACENAVFKKGKKDIGIAVGLPASYGAAQRLYMKRGYVPDGAGAIYDGIPVNFGEMKPMDDLYVLKMVRSLSDPL